MHHERDGSCIMCRPLESYVDAGRGYIRVFQDPLRQQFKKNEKEGT